MPSEIRYQKITIIFLLVTIFVTNIISAILLHYKPKNSGQVLAEQVAIGATVGSCDMEVLAIPEKRADRYINTNNWSTTLRIQIYDNDDFVDTVIVATDHNGRGDVDLCEAGINLADDEYDFRVRGTSHLTRFFEDIGGFGFSQSEIDFSDKLLLAGETSNVFDNEINSLDISTQINAFYTNSVKNDLNRDDEVNSLDISNTIYNFYQTGE